MKPRIYSTLFDGNYSCRGALMIESLVRHSHIPFNVHVLALDERAHAVADWIAKGNRRVVVEDLPALESRWPALVTARSNRTWGHYAWTLGSCWTRDVSLRTLRAVAYLDADVYFFDDPEACWLEVEKSRKSVGCVLHRFPEKYAHYIVNGKRNVSWVSFHDQAGAELLENWAEKCLAKCDATTCGDQRYLDEWDDLLPRQIHDFASKGIGAAPWNVWSYSTCEMGGKVTVDGKPLVFYHFHEHRRDISKADGFDRTRGYPLTPANIDIIYRPYEREYLAMEKRLEEEGIMASEARA